MELRSAVPRNGSTDGSESPLRAIPAILVLAAFERFLFFGTRSELVLAMIHEYGFEQDRAYELYGAFGFVVLLAPLLVWWCFPRLISWAEGAVIGGLILVGGYGLLATSNESAVASGLAAVGVGHGLVRVAVIVAICERVASVDYRRLAAFLCLGIAVNAGTFVGPFLPLVRELIPVGTGPFPVAVGLSVLLVVIAAGCARDPGIPRAKLAIRLGIGSALVAVAALASAFVLLNVQLVEWGVARSAPLVLAALAVAAIAASAERGRRYLGVVSAAVALVASLPGWTSSIGLDLFLGFDRPRETWLIGLFPLPLTLLITCYLYLRFQRATGKSGADVLRLFAIGFAGLALSMALIPVTWPTAEGGLAIVGGEIEGTLSFLAADLIRAAGLALAVACVPRTRVAAAAALVLAGPVVLDSLYSGPFGPDGLFPGQDVTSQWLTAAAIFGGVAVAIYVVAAWRRALANRG